MKPYTTTTDQPHSNTHRQTPLDFTALWMRVVAAVLVIVACIAVVLFAHLPGPLDEAVNTLAGVVAVVAAVYAGVLAVYARLQHYTAYGRGETIKRTNDKQRVVHTHTEAVPKSDGSGVEFHRETRQAEFEYPVEDIARGVEWMLRNGSSRDDVTAGLGWGQKPWARIMRELHNLGVATKQGRSYKLRPERAHDWAQSVLGDDIASIIDELDRM